MRKRKRARCPERWEAWATKSERRASECCKGESGFVRGRFKGEEDNGTATVQCYGQDQPHLRATTSATSLGINIHQQTPLCPAMTLSRLLAEIS